MIHWVIIGGALAAGTVYAVGLIAAEKTIEKGKNTFKLVFKKRKKF